MVVAPGFIDCHSHSDWSLLANRDCASTLLQGVTSEGWVTAGCPYAPVSPLSRERLETDVARNAPGAHSWPGRG